MESVANEALWPSRPRPPACLPGEEDDDAQFIRQTGCAAENDALLVRSAGAGWQSGGTRLSFFTVFHLPLFFPLPGLLLSVLQQRLLRFYVTAFVARLSLAAPHTSFLFCLFFARPAKRFSSSSSSSSSSLADLLPDFFAPGLFALC